ncbi:class I SAM-dependent methyltransferase [Mucilaginibacter sabulilitoris]|uniref:Class I SAM-dependent methyltransferase n=1 Tax=Mucilaginibacter sabulilitoris TaxID=1173583 RepID=A0ABZ0TDP1_9SPHI|nr:class I SAM-dependent methyltransferase [Mucilaginibacter sabulilitoris]WPU91334.1 class I SAM-dependent methyltransferase [Mucilaginibacter sabulilitoris]
MTDIIIANNNEADASAAFTRQSVVFDDIYSENTIINYKRARVRQHVLQRLAPGSSILELNSGTGEDAIFFAREGHRVHATDISTGMQQILRQKSEPYRDRISIEICSFTQLDQLKNKGSFDYIFSNFGGLNCTGELEKVLLSFDALLKPGGKVTMVIIPGFCLWETLLLFRGKFKTAFRRFFSSKGRIAHIEGSYFKCYYYNPSFIINTLKKTFNVSGLEGLCTIVPPSYIEGFAEKHPKAYSFLKDKEDKWKTKWPWKYIGDYFIISLEKK